MFQILIYSGIKAKILVLLAMFAKVGIGWNDPRKREVAHSCS